MPSLKQTRLKQSYAGGYVALSLYFDNNACDRRQGLFVFYIPGRVQRESVQICKREHELIINPCGQYI